LNKSEIRLMEFKPWFLALNGHLQCVTYIMFEIRMKIEFPVKYEREMIKLSDGGTIALDWYID
jgi:predicted alpha/beta-fold hydrolase